jgi:predicted dehydrogenase
MSENIGIGIIGAGFMGMLHARALSQLENVSVTAIQDPAVEKPPVLPRQTKPPVLCKDYQQLLGRDDVDAVVIATPEDLHLDAVIESAAAGKDILLEKPIATTLKDADAIISASSKHGVKLMMAHILRFDVRYAQIKSAVAAGTVGKPLVCYARRNAPIQEARRLNGRVEVEDYISVHDIDQVFWYFDDTAERVSAEIVEGAAMKELGVHDFIWITIRFSKGGLGIVETGWGLSESILRWNKPDSWGGFGDVCLELIGEKGSLYLDYRPMNLHAVDDEGWKFPDTVHWPQLHGEVVGDVLEEDRYFIKVLRGESEIITTVEDGKKALQVVLAAKQSYQNGGVPVKL